METANIALAKLTWSYLHLSFPLFVVLHFHFLFSGQSLCCPVHALVGRELWVVFHCLLVYDFLLLTV